MARMVWAERKSSVDSSSGERRRAWLDAVLAALLFGLVVAYLVQLPLYLGAPDEPRALYEAKRILEGAVMYRDMFEIVTPGWMYLMAGMFWLFGTTLQTARSVAAILQGLIAVAVFAAGRLVGVRRTLAWAAGFATLVLYPPLFPIASQHWLATALMMALAVTCLRMPGSRFAPVAAGGIVGFMLFTHQPRGLAMGVGVVAVLVADALLTRWYGAGSVKTDLFGRVLRFIAGAALIFLPLFAYVVWRAGPDPVWNALIVVPLSRYRQTFHVPWGVVFGRRKWSAFALLGYMPLALIPVGISALLAGYRRREPERVRLSVTLGVLCGFAALSIYYYPAAGHLAFIAPLFFVAIALAVERALRLPGKAISTIGGCALAAAIVLPGARFLWQENVRLKARYREPYMSEFGLVELNGMERRYFQELADAVRTNPSRLLYAYPRGGYAYLFTGAVNPTRFDLVAPRYTSEEQRREVVATLESKRVPFVLLPPGRVPRDSIVEYVEEKYERVGGPGMLANVLWRRKPDARSSGGGIPPAALASPGD
jgi:hypothetical protein